jgi:hypothetical protein
MGAPRKYSLELKERATRMAVEARLNPATARGALGRVAQQLGGSFRGAADLGASGRGRRGCSGWDDEF